MRRQENQQVAIDDHESRIKNIETLVTTANTEITKLNHYGLEIHRLDCE